MASRLQLRLRLTRTGLREAAVSLRHWLADEGIAVQVASRVELVFEEIGSNLLRHVAIPAAGLNLQIELVCRDHGLKMILLDDGPPFDPTAVALADPTLPLSNRPAGGLGLLLVRRLVVDWAYERMEVGNRLVCTFQRTTDTACPVDARD